MDHAPLTCLDCQDSAIMLPFLAELVLPELPVLSVIVLITFY